MAYWKKDFIAVNGYNNDIKRLGARRYRACYPSSLTQELR